MAKKTSTKSKAPLKGTNAADTLIVKHDQITVTAGKGKDKINVNRGSKHKIYGEAGNDVITIGAKAGSGSKIYGDDAKGKLTGNDTFNINVGKKNYFYGGKGADTFNINGGSGNIIDGGAGNDVFVIGKNSTGTAVVKNFSVSKGNTDKVKVTGGAVKSIAVSKNNMVIKGGKNASLTLQNTKNKTFTVTDTLGTYTVSGSNVKLTLNKNYKGTLTAASFVTTVDGKNDANGVTIKGNAKNNTIYGGAGANTIYGNGGNDTLDGGAGNDTLYGGAGNDTLIGGAGDDKMYGGAGNDTFVYSSGNDTIYDYSGTDKIKLASTTLTDSTVSGNDVILNLANGRKITVKNAKGSNIRIVDFSGKEQTINNSGSDTTYDSVVTGSEGKDTFVYSPDDGAAIIKGYTEGEDTLQIADGTVTKTQIVKGNVVLTVGDEGNTITLEGAAGKTIDMQDSNGSFTLSDEEIRLGSDYTGNLDAGAYLATVTTIDGQNATNTVNITGNDQDNTIYVGKAGGIIDGGAGNDTLHGGAGNDTLIGGIGSDKLYGGEGSDTLTGGAGDDTLSGGAGNDTLDSDAGNDTLTGGSGSDTYIVSSGFTADTLIAIDQAGFTAGDADILKLQTLNHDAVAYSLDEGVLTITDKATGGKVTVAGWDVNPLSKIVFSDHESITGDQVNEKFSDAEHVIPISDNDEIYYTVDCPKNKFVFSGSGWSAMIYNSGSNDTLDFSSYSDGQYGFSSNYRGGDHLYLTFSKYDEAGDEEEVGSIIIIDYFASDEKLGKVVLYDNASGEARSYNMLADTNGGAGNDLILKNTEDGDLTNVIDGGAGNDVIFGSRGSDTLNGGAGDDTLYGGNGNNTLNGDAGNDILYGGNGDATLNGGEGNDTLYGGFWSDTLNGGTGDDKLYGGAGSDTFVYSSGHDTIYDYSGEDTIKLASTTLKDSAASGDDVILNLANGETVTVKNAANMDIRIVDKNGKEETVNNSNGAGNSTITYGSEGADTFVYAAGSGNTIIKGYEESQDTIEIGGGTITGTSLSNQDVVFTVGSGSVTVENGSGKTISIKDSRGSYTASDTAITLGSDFTGTMDANAYLSTVTTVDGSAVEDVVNITGNDQDNTIYAGKAGGTIDGGAGNDTLHGGAGDDTLNGGASDDTLYGGVGNDTLTGGAGDDKLYGGAGSDTFVYSSGHDTIYDYSGEDTIKLASTTLTGSTVSGNDVILDLAEGGKITVKDAKGTDVILVDSEGKEQIIDSSFDGNIVYGSSGADTFVYAAGSGDTIIKGYEAGQDTVEITGGTVSGTALANSNKDLVFTVGSGTVTLTDGSGKTISIQDSRGSYTASNTTIALGADFTGNMDAGAYLATVTTVDGSAAEDVVNITGNNQGNTIYAGKAGGTIDGGAGNDTLYGGAGEDTLYGGVGNDELLGGADNDALYGGEGEDTLSGGAGNDTLTSDAGNDTLTGGTGSDTYIVSSGFTADTLIAIDQAGFTAGDTDILKLQTLNHDAVAYSLEEGVLTITDNATGGKVTVTGWDVNPLSEIVFADNERVTSGQINEIVSDTSYIIPISDNASGAYTAEHWKNTFVFSGSGWSASIRGAGSNDTLDFSSYTDGQYGFSSNYRAGDNLYLTFSKYDEAGNKTELGTIIIRDYFASDEKLGTVILYDNASGEVRSYNMLADTNGGAGNELIFKTTEDNDLANVIDGGAGNDVIFGSRGSDTLNGGNGDDAIYGGTGNDTLYGGAGNDTLTGGAGKDTFVYANGDGNDTVTDYTAGQDTLAFSNDSVTQTTLSGTSVVFMVGSGTVTAENGSGKTISIQDSRGSYTASDTTIALGADFTGNMDAGAYLSTVTKIDGRNAEGAVNITGNGQDNIIYAGKSGGTTDGGSGNDTLYGGAGNDILNGGAGNDTLYGGDGNNVLSGDDGNDTLYGGDGSDTFVYSSGHDTIYDYSGEDTIKLASTTLTDSAASGDDVILNLANGEAITVKNAANMDIRIVDTNGKELTVNNSNGAGNSNTVYGSEGADTFAYAAGSGNTTIKGYEESQDTIEIGGGTITGTSLSNQDVVFTVGSGSVTVENGSGKTISIKDSRGSYTASDTTIALGADFSGTLDTNAYLSTVTTVDGSAAEDAVNITGNDKNNTIYAGKAGGTIDGGAGNDTLHGGAGIDILTGGSGNDTLYGGAGNDTLTGGTGEDTLSGGAGSDTFVYSSGHDTIYDYSGEDTIKLASTTLTGSTVSGNDVILNLAEGGKITVKDAKGTDVILVDSEGKEQIIDSSFDGNILYGSSGADTFAYAAGCGNTTIKGYEAGQDTVEITGGTVSGTALANSNKDLVFTVGSGTVTLTDGSGKTISIKDSRGSYTASDTTIALGADFSGTLDTNAYLSTVTTVDGSAAEDAVNITGNDKNNTIYAGKAGGTIDGGVGNDTLTGGTGEDTLSGGAGNDTLTSDAGNDTLIGGAGSDTYNITSNFTADTLITIDQTELAAGDADTLNLNTLNHDAVAYSLEEGVLTITDNATGGKVTVSGWDVNPLSQILFADNESVTSDQVNEIITNAPYIIPVNKSTTYTADHTNHPKNTFVFSGTGWTYARIEGAGSNDTLDFSDYRDGEYRFSKFNISGVDLDHLYNLKLTFSKYDEEGTATTVGSVTLVDYFVADDKPGNLALYDNAGGAVRSYNLLVDASGGNENDFIVKVNADYDLTNVIDGGAGDDIMYGSTGRDALNGGDGNDVLYGMGGNNIVNGGAGDDKLYGGAGNDTLNGDDGKDELYGILGDNTLNGGAGDDTLYGGVGNDTLTGGADNDTLYGGAGNDTFVYAAGNGNDVVTDYTEGEDILQFSGGAVSGMNVTNNDIVFTVGEGSITLQNAADKTLSLSYGKGSFTLNGSTITLGSDFAGSLDASGFPVDTFYIGACKGSVLTGGQGADSFIFVNPTGNHVIADYEQGIDVLRFDTDTVTDSAVSGTDIMLTLSGGATVAVKNRAMQSVTFTDLTGKEFTLSPLITQQSVIKSFMKSLDDTVKTPARDALNAAVNYASVGYFPTWDSLIDRFVSDVQNHGGKAANNGYTIENGQNKVEESTDTFLKTFCGIDLSNADTGAITGLDAGGVLKTADTVVPESGTLAAAQYPTGDSLTIGNLTIRWPDQSKLSDAEKLIVSGLNTYWVREALSLVEESYGIVYPEEGSFGSKGFTMNLFFPDNADSTTLASAASSSLSINMHYYKGLDATNPNGVSAATSFFLDRTLAHEFTHAVMCAALYDPDNIEDLGYVENDKGELVHTLKDHGDDLWNELSETYDCVTEGLAELVHGIDDERFTDICRLAQSKNSDTLQSALTTSNYDSYAGGYMLLRYFAKQVSDYWNEGTTTQSNAMLASSGTDSSESLVNLASIHSAMIDFADHTLSDAVSGTQKEESQTNSLFITGNI